MDKACVMKLIRQYETDGSHGVKPRIADAREAIARGWRG